jgi:hypothetical protein
MTVLGRSFPVARACDFVKCGRRARFANLPLKPVGRAEIASTNYDVDGIRQKLPTAAHRAIRGDMTRATLDALRDAPGPMTTIELARHVMAERGLNTADKALLQLFTRRTGALLRWQRKRGILRSVKDPQHGRFDL